MKESIQLKVSFPVEPSEIYRAWLDSEGHSLMTGGEAHCSSDIGASFSAWDGYISGKNLVLLENEEIQQSWRTTEFAESDEDSLLSIKLAATGTGTELTLIHTNIPEGQTQYRLGWVNHYFEPMAAYFG